MTVIYQWDDDKDESNFIKHGVTFDEAMEVFSDINHITTIDKRYDYDEERFVTFGKIESRLYVVVHTLRDQYIRIISARKGNKREQRKYYIQNLRP